MNLALAWLVAGAAAGAPPAGHYDAQLCVSVSAEAPQCGPAAVRVAPDGELHVRVHGFAYRLGFAGTVMVGVILHGNMQVQEFLSSYRWAGTTLLFGDRARGLRYELQLGAPAGGPLR